MKTTTTNAAAAALDAVTGQDAAATLKVISQAANLLAYQIHERTGGIGSNPIQFVPAFTEEEAAEARARLRNLRTAEAALAAALS